MKKILPSRLKIAREKLGWTQEQACGKLNISIGTLSGYERGYRSPNPEMIAKLSSLYCVSTDYLLGRTDDPTPPQAPIKEPTPEEQVLSAVEIGEALRISFNLFSKGKIDELTCYKLTKLAEEKFGLPSVKSDKVARAKYRTPGSGILGDDKNEKNNLGNAKKHSRNVGDKSKIRKSSPKPDGNG